MRELFCALLACMVLASGARSPPSAPPASESCPPPNPGNRVQGVFIPKDASPEVKARLEKLKSCLNAKRR